MGPWVCISGDPGKNALTEFGESTISQITYKTLLRKEVGILISIAEKSSIHKDFRKLKYRGKFLPGSQKVFFAYCVVEDKNQFSAQKKKKHFLILKATITKDEVLKYLYKSCKPCL